MDRKEFLSAFGVGLAAVCAGCLASCSKSDTTPPTGGGPGPNPPTRVNFAVDLNSEIKNVGDAITKNGVIVVRLATGTAIGSFSAVQVACTHQGTAIEFNSSQGNFVCPNHGSRFSSAGAVLNGPATSNLKKYNIVIAGNTMNVSD